MSPVAIRRTDTPLDAFNPDVNYVALRLAGADGWQGQPVHGRNLPAVVRCANAPA